MTDPTAAPPHPDRSPEEIEEHLSQTRDDLEQTLEALTDKLDVKSRSTRWVADMSETASTHAREVAADHGRELAVAAAAVGALAAVLVWRARRR